MTLEQPAGEMWQKIREELNEKADTKEADLAHIKEWLKKEPHLPDEFGKFTLHPSFPSPIYWHDNIYLSWYT